MCEAVGHPVARLVRTRIGPLADRSLAPRDLAPPHPGRGAGAASGRAKGARASGPCADDLPQSRALRGATTIDVDKPAHIDRAGGGAADSRCFERNGVDHDDIISIIFTATEDVVSMFPATAARTLRARRRAADLRPRSCRRARAARRCASG